jgi:hypothetical protein
VFIPLKTENPNIHNEHFLMKLYDNDLKVVNKSNDEALQVSHRRSSTHVWCMDVSQALVQQCSEEEDSDRCPNNTTTCSWMRILKSCACSKLGNTRDGEVRRGREKSMDE